LAEEVSLQFSDVFGISDAEDQEWFNPFLDIDTELFIDPFLIYGNEVGLFSGAHQEVIGFFGHIFEQLAKSSGNRGSAYWKKAVDCLSFPEVEELCLGYTAEGTGGAGSGKDIARQIAQAIWTAIDLGTESLSHFEEVQIFERGIGPDRISDATARILLHRFAKYTEAVAKFYKLKTKLCRYGRAQYDVAEAKWLSGEYELPINEKNGKPIFLVPKRYLRPLPTINAEDFLNYCIDNEASAIADTLGIDIITRVPKKEIVKLALQNPEARERYIAHREAEGSDPYDFVIDPRGFIKWYESTKEWGRQNNPEISFSTEEEFLRFIHESIFLFKNYVENQGGWSLIWNENETPKREDASQRLFLGIVSQICAANNVDISREVNVGRGHVDFKVSSGFHRRALIEVKLAKNTKFWDGLEAQLPTYLKAEQVKTGWFVVIVYTDKDIDRISKIEERVEILNDRLPYDIRPIIIDARSHPPSASTLKLFG